MTADAVGGVWDYSLQLAGALAGEGIHVTLATMGPRPSPDQRAAAAAIDRLGVVSREYRLEWMDDPWDDVARAGDWLLELESMVSPDVVHLNGYAHGVLSWRAPVLMVGHSCVYSWLAAVHGTPPPDAWTSYKNRVRAGLQAADTIVTPTRTMLLALAAHYGPLDGIVIPNARDHRAFSPGAKDRFVLCAGRLWDEAKNVRALTAVASQLPWPVYLAGDSGGRADGPIDAANVHVLGRLPSTTLRQWLACASLYVLPSRYEPFGLSVLEAALSRCALVLNDIPSLRESWDEAAVFVPADDRAALRDAVCDLIASPRCLGTFADRAYVRAREFSVERLVRAYLDAYGALVREPAAISPGSLPCGL